MKRKIYYIAFIFAILSIIIFLMVNKRRILIRDFNYVVYSNTSKELPIKLFSRNSVHKYGRDNEPIINEIILYIDKDINMEGDGFDYQVLSIHKSSASIFKTRRGRDVFWNIGNFFLYQNSMYASHDFHPLYNNYFNYDDKMEEPIKFFIAKGNKYQFNSFGGLKQFGDTIIVERLDGKIENEVFYLSDSARVSSVLN